MKKEDNRRTTVINCTEKEAKRVLGMYFDFLSARCANYLACGDVHVRYISDVSDEEFEAFQQGLETCYISIDKKLLIYRGHTHEV